METNSLTYVIQKVRFDDPALGCINLLRRGFAFKMLDAAVYRPEGEAPI